MKQFTFIIFTLLLCTNPKPKNGFMEYQGWMNYGDYVMWMDTDFKMHVFIPEFYQFKLLVGNQYLNYQSVDWSKFDSWWIITDNSPFIVDRNFRPVTINVLQIIKEETK